MAPQSCSQCLTLNHRPYVLSTRPFGTKLLVIFYLLPHTEIVKGCSLQGRLVKEKFTSFTEDEPKLLVVQSLDRTVWHVDSFSTRNPSCSELVSS